MNWIQQLYTNIADLITRTKGLDDIHDDVGTAILDTQVKKVASGSKTLGTGVTKYLHIDSGTNGAEILAIIIKGVVGADWTLDIYIPAEDGAGATAAGDKRDSIPYVNTDTEGGLLSPFAIAYDCYLDFTNDSGGDDNIDEVIVVYRSRGTLTLTWET